MWQFKSVFEKKLASGLKREGLPCYLINKSKLKQSRFSFCKVILSIVVNREEIGKKIKIAKNILYFSNIAVFR
ncbi:MAG: hypothetical protein AAF063_22490 [Cyanobacteria bacterium J06643_5]